MGQTVEFMDIVDENDNITDKASKQDVYKKSYTHRIVHVLVFNNENKIALQLRANVSFCPYHWSTSVGGHVQSGESYEQAAIRESEEEIGIKPKVEFFSKDLYTAPNGLKKFLATFKSTFNGPFDIDPGAVDSVKFFTIDEIQKMIDNGEKIHPELLFILRKHFGIR